MTSCVLWKQTSFCCNWDGSLQDFDKIWIASRQFFMLGLLFTDCRLFTRLLGSSALYICILLYSILLVNIGSQINRIWFTVSNDVFRLASLHSCFSLSWQGHPLSSWDKTDSKRYLGSSSGAPGFTSSVIQIWNCPCHIYMSLRLSSEFSGLAWYGHNFVLMTY